MEPLKLLSTTGDVIDVLGGNAAVARRFGVSPQVVSNWRVGTFPSKTYVAIQAELKPMGYTAAPSLFRMIGVADEPSTHQRASA